MILAPMYYYCLGLLIGVLVLRRVQDMRRQNRIHTHLRVAVYDWLDTPDHNSCLQPAGTRAKSFDLYTEAGWDQACRTWYIVLFEGDSAMLLAQAEKHRKMNTLYGYRVSHSLTTAVNEHLAGKKR